MSAVDSTMLLPETNYVSVYITCIQTGIGSPEEYRNYSTHYVRWSWKDVKVPSEGSACKRWLFLSW